MNLNVAVLGNTDPKVWWSTENEYVDAWQRVGATVTPYHEMHAADWRRLIDDVRDDSFDVVQWTSTRDYSVGVGPALQWELSAACKRHDTPLIGIHLDIWFGFEREADVTALPYFRAVDLLFTADGGNQERWDELGIEHRWLLPAISERWLGVGTPQLKYRSKIAFTGSWEGHYHPEAEHRHQLVKWLQDTYGDDVRFYPKRGQQRLHGFELNDLYASVDVVVGDSAVLPGKDHYCSDRIPETLGRGGYLLHPAVGGIVDEYGGPFKRDDAPLCDYWEAWDWAELKTRIDEELETGQWGAIEERQRRVDRIANGHTYTHRVNEVISVLAAKGML